MTKDLHPRTIRLHELMRDYKLDCYDVANILDRTPGTVRKWRCEYRVIPKDKLTLLERYLLDGVWL